MRGMRILANPSSPSCENTSPNHYHERFAEARLRSVNHLEILPSWKLCYGYETIPELPSGPGILSHIRDGRKSHELYAVRFQSHIFCLSVTAWSKCRSAMIYHAFFFAQNILSSQVNLAFNFFYP